jgi:hypothetical protein
MSTIGQQLDTIDARLSELRSRLHEEEARYRRELEQLNQSFETATQMLRMELASTYDEAARLTRSESILASTANGSAYNSPPIQANRPTIAEVSVEVLKQSSAKKLHFNDVARESVQHGYIPPEGRTAANPTSFRRTLHKRQDLFVREGEGIYSLKEK